MFDVPKMADAAVAAILRFASEHRTETFYAFAIDANMLCLNSLEDFEKTLEYYQQKWPDHYREESAIAELKANTGDWRYQGFFDLGEEHGFDQDLYNEHYDAAMASDDGHASDTAYSQAMTALIAELQARNAFTPLTRTDDFSVSWVDHTY